MNSTIHTRPRKLKNLAARDGATNRPASYLATLAPMWLLVCLSEPKERIALAALLTLAVIGALQRARRQPCLRVLYRGQDLTVDETNIKPHMEVPNDGGPFGYDNFGGPTAAALFVTAVAHGAIKVPAQLQVQAFANETHGNDLILLATTGRARASTGWLDSASIGVRYTDESHDRDNVASALRFMAAQLNAALHPAT